MPSLVVTSLVWAFSFGIIKRYLGRVDPSVVAFLRLALAGLLFLPWLRRGKVRLRVQAELAALGAVQFGLMYLFYLLAFRHLQSYQVALLTIMTPIWVCLVEDVQRRRLALVPIVLAVAATIGAAVVLSGGPFGRPDWKGILLIQASNACFAVGQIYYRRFRPRLLALHERTLMAWSYMGGALVTLPFAAPGLPAALGQLTLPEVAVILYLGFVASGLGFFLWNHGALQVSTATLAVMNDLKTPLAVVVSLVVFHEVVRLDRLSIGGAIVIFAALAAQRHGRRIAD